MLYESQFQAAWWLPGAHAQTLWASLARKPSKPQTRRERLELDDGDFVDLDWVGGDTGPIVCIFHGLAGSSASPYARGLLGALSAQGRRAVVMNFRGCSGEPNRLASSYHSGHSSDMRRLFDELRRREPHVPLAAIGFSLGGNALLVYQGEQGASSPLAKAIAVSPPLMLDEAARRMDHGLSKIYQRHLLKGLWRSLREKQARDIPLPTAAMQPELLKRFWDFDDQITAPLHGYDGVDDYYARASARPWLKEIQRPTHIIHAKDDPFFTPRVIPQERELGPGVSFELARQGGHVGFVSGRWPWRADYWLDARLSELLSAAFAEA